MYVPGGNVGTAVSYFEGAMLLIYNCEAVLTDTMGPLNKVITSADCREFTDYMKFICCS